MNIAIVSGSHRKESESARVSKYLSSVLDKKKITSVIFDLGNSPLPFWDESLWGKELPEKWIPFKKQLNSVFENIDGFIIVSPEWSGMATPALKNFFLVADTLCDNLFAYKPALLVSVSSGRGGSYPISELRTSSYKNTKLSYIPDHVIVQDVKSVLHSDKKTLDEKSDAYIQKRIDWTLDVLVGYTSALGVFRDSFSQKIDKYPYGM